MTTNLRLDDEWDQGLASQEHPRDQAAAGGLVRPPSAFVDAEPAVMLPAGTTTLGLLDRSESST